MTGVPQLHEHNYEAPASFACDFDSFEQLAPVALTQEFFDELPMCPWSEHMNCILQIGEEHFGALASTFSGGLLCHHCLKQALACLWLFSLW